MSQNYGAVAHPGWSGDPATDDAAFKQFVRIGCVIQESGRPHDAKSSCVKHQEYFRGYANDDVVGEFILSNYVEQLGGRLSPKRPEHRLFKRRNDPTSLRMSAGIGFLQKFEWCPRRDSNARPPA